MKKLMLIALLATLGTANAAVITFDEVPAAPGTALSGPYGTTGVSFSATNHGIQQGLANGDAGNWGVDGTNGPQFLGFNGIDDPYSQIVTFATAVTGVSVDFSRTLGSVDGTIELQAFDGATLVASVSTLLGAVNSWSTLTVNAANITSVQWTGTGSNFHPFGADNLTYVTAEVPEPGTLALLGLGAVAFGINRRKRKSLHAA